MAPSPGNGQFDSLPAALSPSPSLITTFHRTPTLKTYSKRVPHNTEGPSTKKIPVEDPIPVNFPPQAKKRRLKDPSPANSAPVKKVKGTTIQSYFKPLQTSSSPITKPASSLPSDPLEPTSTPPSSPPTRSSPSIETPRQPQKRPKRRLTTRPALAPLLNMSSQGISDSGYDDSSYSDGPLLGREPRHTPNTEGKNENGSNNPSGSSLNVARPSTQNLYQTQLDMGVPATKRCQVCGMHYNATLAHDRRLHDKYHSGIVEAKQPKNVSAGINLWEKYDGTNHHLIRVIDHRASAALKDAARKAIDATVPQLGGWDQQYNHRDLWALITNPDDEHDLNEVPRYKIYLYLINFEVFGVLLVERIAVGVLYYSGPVIYNKEGRIPEEVVRDSPLDETQEFVYADEKYDCYMGIDRIWVRREMHRNGYARQLLNHALSTFIPGMTVSKAQISFSQPTLLGREFASSYCRGVFKDGLFLTDLGHNLPRVQDGILHSS